MSRNIYILIVINLSLSGFGLCQKSEKLFKKIDSSYSNITFNNVLEDTPEHSIMIYSNFYGGGGSRNW